MKVVVALDKFKGSLTAPDACEIVKRALLSVRPDLQVVCKPMADGGEGTARALIAALDGEWIRETVTGPLPDRKVEAGYGWFARERAAVVEMAVASGLALLKPAAYDPLHATTYGTGELIKAATQRGAQRIWLAVGGSATVDGGVGAAMALGWTFLNTDEKSVGLGGGELERIRTILPPEEIVGQAPRLPDDRSRQAERLPYNLPAVEVLCDVDNLLCGDHGAARVFGPQKGATPQMVERLDAGLRHLATLVREQHSKDILTVPGAGAAGGLAAGALAFMNAKLVPGIDTIIRFSKLDREIEGADWVITGEGRFDEQSLHGKVVSGVATLARKSGAKVAVIAGSVGLSETQCQAREIEVTLALQRTGVSLEYAMGHAAELLAERARELAKTITS